MRSRECRRSLRALRSQAEPENEELRENSSRTAPESGRSSSAGAQRTARPHAARYDVRRIGEGSSQGNAGMRENWHTSSG